MTSPTVTMVKPPSPQTILTGNPNDFLSPQDVCRMLPSRNGKRVNVSTIYRWANAGIRGVRLRMVQIGGCRYVARADLNAFLVAIQPLQ